MKPKYMMKRAMKYAIDPFDLMVYENTQLMEENDKLRELIRIMWLAGDFRAFLGVEEIKERMRELGIEVR